MSPIIKGGSTPLVADFTHLFKKIWHFYVVQKDFDASFFCVEILF